MAQYDCIMSLDDRVLHLAGEPVGYAICGARIQHPWIIGDLIHVGDKAEAPCETCLFGDVA